MMKEKLSLLIIGNSNSGKTSIAKLLLPHPKEYKGKIGKDPGSTLLIKPIEQKDLPYKIIDMPGFGFAAHSSRRRTEHIKNQIVIHIEKHHQEYFFALIIVSTLRIQDEITKYFLENEETVPLSFELITFLRENSLPLLIIFNKIDRLSKYDTEKAIGLFIDSAREYGLNLINLDQYSENVIEQIPYLEFSAIKKINLGKLKEIIYKHLK